MKRSGPIVGVLAVAMLMATALPAYAAAGDFDTTFDGDGIAYADFGVGNVDPFGVAIQTNNGRIVVAGYVTGATVDFGVARLNTDGSLDPNFGTAGLTTTNFAGGNDYAFDVAIGGDGRIVVAGDRYDTSSFTAQFAVARYRRG